jgi:hypothetical protein
VLRHVSCGQDRRKFVPVSAHLSQYTVNVFDAGGGGGLAAGGGVHRSGCLCVVGSSGWQCGLSLSAVVSTGGSLLRLQHNKSL